MTREEAKTVFLNRGYVEVDNGTYYSPDKWREACVVISEWLEQEPTITSTEDNAEMVYPQVEGITPTVVNEDIYECSCGYGWDKNKTSRFHFCPNCGKAVGDGNDYKYIKSISNPTGIEFDIDIPKKIESYEKLLKHPVIKHIMDMDETREQLDFVQPHKRIPVTLTVESGDCISREAIKKDLKNCKVTEIRDEDDDLVGYYNADTVDSIVRNLPPVKPQERTGHWNLFHTTEHGMREDSYFKCDRCNYESYKEYNFCPNCGAKMEVENDTNSRFNI